MEKTVSGRATVELFNKPLFIRREREIEAFIKQFDELLIGSTGIITIIGEAGIGKTFLVQHAVQLLRPNAFLYGKNQQDQKGSFVAIAQVINQISNNILTLPKDSKGVLIDELNEKVGEDLAFLASISPGLKTLFDVSHAKEIEDFDRRKYRVKSAVLKFIMCASRYFFPMVVYLDDLQWADPFSLEIIKTLISKRNQLNVLLVTSFRDNEITKDMDKLVELLKKESLFIKLEQVDFDYVQDYLEQVFENKLTKKNQMARLVFGLTSGNPFYIKTILRILIEEDVIFYSEKENTWEVDSKRINHYAIDENIETLLKEKIVEVQKGENQLLGILACLGGKTTEAVLAAVAGMTTQTLNQHIGRLIDAAIIYRNRTENGEIELFFSHDIIYRLIDNHLDQDEKERVFYHIAKTASREALGIENVESFIASYLLRVPKKWIQEQADAWISTLFQAGLHEKKTAAIENAHAIFEFCMALTPFCRNLTHDFLIEINLEFAELLCFFKRYEESEQIIQNLLESSIDKAAFIQIQRKKLYIHHHKREHKATIATGTVLLNALGIKFGRNRLVIDLIKCARFYTAKRINAIHMTSQDKDERIALIIDILILMNSSAAVINDDIKASIGLTAALVSANDPGSSNALMGYASYAYVLLILSHRREKTKVLVDTIAAMIDETEDNSSKPTVYLLLGAFLNHWSHPLADSALYLQKGIKYSEMLGDFQFIGYCCYARLDTMEIMGVSLNSILDYIQQCRDAYSDVEQYVTTYRFKVYEAHIAALKTGEGNLDFDRISARYPMLTPNENYIEEILLLERLYLLEYTDEAFALVKRIRAKLKYSKTYIFRIDILLFCILSMIAVYHQKGTLEQSALNRVMRRFLKELKLISKYQPDNFFCYSAIADAEYRTHILNDSSTIGLFNEAINRARQGGNLKIEALGNLLAARSEHKNHVLAAFYAKEAVRLYTVWGADAAAKKTESDFHIRTDKTTAAEKAEPKVGKRIISIEDFAHQTEKLSERDAVRMYFDVLAANGYTADCALLIEKEDELFLKYRWREDEGFKAYGDAVNINYIPALPHKLMRYVARVGDAVVFEAGKEHSLFSNDPYILDHPNLNMICVPMKLQRVFFGMVFLAVDRQMFTDADFVYIKGFIPMLVTKMSESQAAPIEMRLRKKNSDTDLTKREIEILKLVKRGFSNDEISGKLNITLGTVKIHMNNILRKLDSDSRVKAVVVAEEQNII